MSASAVMKERLICAQWGKKMREVEAIVSAPILARAQLETAVAISCRVIEDTVSRILEIGK